MDLGRVYMIMTDGDLLGIEVHRDYAHQGFKKGEDSQVEWRVVLGEGLEKPLHPQKLKQWLSQLCQGFEG
jgi:hypothetical protein